MITFCNILFFVIIPFLVSAILFIFLMLCFKKKINGRPNLKDELRSSQIEYHNNAIYKAFEFYIKMMLALLGGISFILLTKQDNSNNENINILIQCGGIFIFCITLLFCMLVIGHQKAKIERWTKKFKWHEIIWWNELWFVSMSIALAIFVYFSVIKKHLLII